MKSIGVTSTSLTTNFTKQDSIILNIQRACQAMQDMASRIIRLKQLGIPQHSRDAFDFLADHHLIERHQADTLMKMVGFRNIAVHEYQKLNPAILEAIIEKHLAEIETIAGMLLKTIKPVEP